MNKKDISPIIPQVSMKNWLIIGLILFLTLIALMNFTRFVLNELAVGKPGRFRFYFIMETTGAFTILFLVPFLLWFFKKFPIRRKNLSTRIPLYLLASMVYGASHTMLMYSSRMIIFWLGNLGPYNYGRFIYRFPMEYSHQFFTFWFIFATVYFIKSIQEHQEQKLRASQLEQQLTKASLQALQMQLHPHFLFNTLNMISSTMYENVKMADRMMANLSDLLRLTLNSASYSEHTLEKELEIVQLYIEIMRARFGDKLLAKMEIDSETKEALVPGFILQPLVENAIKYSLESSKAVEIKISSQKENDKMRLIIQDNGPGISGNPDKIIQNGFGLSNTVERLEKLFGTNHRFHLKNISEGGLQVVMEIPFRKSPVEENSDERH